MSLNRRQDHNGRTVSGTTKEEAILLLLYFMVFLFSKKRKIPPIFSRDCFSLRIFLIYLLSNGALTKKILQTYVAKVSVLHQGFKYSPSGLIVNPFYPHLGASPDELVNCDCCFGEGVLEIKCPFSGRDCNPAELHKLKNSF